MSLALLALSGIALAGYSTDIELARPTFSTFAMPGLDVADAPVAGGLRAGTVLMYTRDPLVLYRGKRELGAVIGQRAMTTFGVSADVSSRVTLRAALPLAGQWASETPRFAEDTIGTGDMSLGARVHAIDLGPVALAGSADVYLPTGKQEAYLGEGSVRANAGLLAEADLGPVTALVNLGVMGRPRQDTGEDFVLGSELALGGSLLVDAWPERVAVGPGILARTGLENAFQGDAETPVEFIFGGSYALGRQWMLDAGVGRGIAAGYGTSQFRSWAGVTWVRRPAPPVPMAVAIEPPPPEPEPEPELADVDLEPPEPPPPPPVWKPQELVRVEEAQIVIRDPIQFELGTNRILAVSEPTMRAIAKLMSEKPEIAHLVIEGHASEEGDFRYNYKLSLERSLAVYEALVAAGVHPWRMSSRAMGEVQPIVSGDSPEALATNRRVLFHVVRQLRSDEALPPEMTAPVKVPWTGEVAPVLPLPERAPPPPVEVAPPPPPPSPDDAVDPSRFREEEDR